MVYHEGAGSQGASYPAARSKQPVAPVQPHPGTSGISLGMGTGQGQHGIWACWGWHKHPGFVLMVPGGGQGHGGLRSQLLRMLTWRNKTCFNIESDRPQYNPRK